MPRILLVDDDPSLLAALSRHFRQSHSEFEIATAANGRLAMSLLADSVFDVAVLDLLMPEQDGIEMIVAIRRAHPLVQVIAMSGGAGSMGMDLLTVAQMLGAHMTIEKPFEPEALIAKVRALLAP